MTQKSILFLFLFISIFSRAQNVNEILNFLVDNPNGTARFESMGGAFGALGGDLSAININPAGSAVFNDNEYGFTLSSEKKENKTEQTVFMLSDGDKKLLAQHKKEIPDKEIVVDNTDGFNEDEVAYDIATPEPSCGPLISRSSR